MHVWHFQSLLWEPGTAKREGVGGVAQRRWVTVEHAVQVLSTDKLPGNKQEFKQTGVPCLRFQAPVFFWVSW